MAIASAVLVLTGILIGANGLEDDVKFQLGKQAVAIETQKNEIMEIKQQLSASMERETQLRAQVSQLLSRVNAVSDSSSSLEQQVKSNTEKTSKLEQDGVARDLKDSSAAAFMAKPMTVQVMNQDSEAIKFDNVLYMTTRAFDSSTGRFTAPIRGVYAFQSTFTILCMTEYCRIALHVSGNEKIDQRYDNKFIRGSLSSVWELQPGDEVEMRWRHGKGQVWTTPGSFTMFSGYLVKAL